MQDHVVEDQAEVFRLLGDPATHGLRAPVRRIDTHGAAVFLAGPYAYKVKRAVKFPFMDFSTLERRRCACARELEVNRPNAPDLYLDVVAITRGPAGLALGGAGEAVEYAVRMRRFDETATLDHVAEARLAPDLCARLAQVIHAAHARAERRHNGNPADQIMRIARENIADLASDPALFATGEVEALSRATEAALARLAPLLTARGAAGHVRRCHGDLHLRNIVLIEGTPTLFDAVEFNDDIATCDVLYDLAFLLMDLWERGLAEPANLVLNRYLWRADRDDHYAGLAALPLFLSLRAAIRAKVEAAGLRHLAPTARPAARTRVLAHFHAAAAFLAPGPTRLLAVGGLSGSGKSTLAAALAPHLGRAPGAVILRSDIARKVLAGVGETERLPPQAYTPGTSAAVYELIRRRAGLALSAGHGAVLDAVHARAQERRAAADLAAAHGARFDGLWLDAPVETLARRVDERRGDASDATPEVVRQQAGYEIGPMNWHRLDTSAGPQETRRAARDALGLSG